MDMALISLRDVGVVTPRALFQNVTFSFGPDDRVGLVAGNGGGRSTLLRCIAGQADPDMGSIVLSRGLRIGHVEQDVPDALRHLTLHEAVRRAQPPAGRAHEAWRAGAVLDEFETPDDLRDRPVEALNGGWQHLALLARARVAQPDALLLDEPANRLDGEKINLLEAWINGPAARTPMLVASHPQLPRQLHHPDLVLASWRQPRLRPEQRSLRGTCKAAEQHRAVAQGKAAWGVPEQVRSHRAPATSHRGR